MSPDLPLLPGLVRETEADLSGVVASADFDGDRAYRYILTRTWARGLPAVLWVMLNPSTADAFRVDPTAHRCLNRSKSLAASTPVLAQVAFGSMTIANLFALRSPCPAALLLAGDPVGPRNDEVLRMLLPLHQAVIVAWGSQPQARDRAREVLAMIAEAGHVPLCLGTTKDGQPLHPGRLAYSVQLREYDLAGAA
jgi:hypothetical protein